MNGELKVIGKQNFMGKYIPVILGGFGEGNKCVSDKTVAEIHGITTSDVRKAIGRNITRFKEYIDYIDMKSPSPDDDLLKSLGYTKQQMVQAEHIYILSERGYAKLIKIMDTDLAWEIHDKMIDNYFHMREELKNVNESLDSVNAAITIIVPLLEREGCPNKIMLLTAKMLYRKAGIELPIEIQAEKKYFDKTQIAQSLGMYTKSGNPASQAVGSIIKKISLDKTMYIETFEAKGNWQGTVTKYSQDVVKMVRDWIEEAGYPDCIECVQKNGVKNFRVYYKNVVEEAV